MESRQISRRAVRALLEDHVRQQYQAETDGLWHAVQNDINDDLAQHRARIEAEAGEVEAERFMRIYAQEQLAYERDARANPAAAARRMAGRAGQGEQRGQAPRQPVKALAAAARNHPPSASWVLILATVIGAFALLF